MCERFGLIFAVAKILILTGQRRGEVAGMSWGEVADDLMT
jgi:hypothetical protein